MRVNIKPAAIGKYRHNYDVMTIASMDFNQLVISSVTECVASDEVNNYRGKARLRLAPQVFPAYGKLYLKSAAFFVPEYQIYEYSEALRNNMNMYKGKAIDFVHIKHFQISYLFSTHYNNQIFDWCTLVATANSTSAFPQRNTFDFVDIVNNSSATQWKFYKLTALGRSMYKILKGCGIDFPSYGSTGTYVDDQAYADSIISVNCLLSYAKIWCDMFLNSHQYNDNMLVALLHHIHDNDGFSVGGISYYDNTTFSLTTTAIGLILESIMIPHSQNMYTTAWNSPNNPIGVSNNSVMDGVNPNGPLSPYTGSNTTSAGTFNSDQVSDQLQTSNGGAIYTLNSFGNRVFRGFIDFVRRNNLFGNKAVERTLARIGIKSDDYKSHYVHKLWEGSSRIDFSAIMSNSDTVPSGGSSGKTLGSYAGFGIAGMDIDFNYKCQENGFIFVLSWIQEAPIWIRGTSPFNFRRYAFDWWTPEYDGQTIRAIPFGEFTAAKIPVRASYSDKSIYGYTDLYDEYRFGRDQILGDFVLDEETTRNFFFGRDLSAEREFGMSLQVKPQAGFVQYYKDYPVSNNGLTNPFQWTAALADRFYLSIDWDINMVRPIKSKSEAIMLNGEGNLDINLGGHDID